MKKFSLIVLMIGCSLMASAALSLKTAAGWQESAYMEFTGLNDSYAFYNAYVSEDGGSNWTKLDGMLVRSYGTYGRVDAVGLKAGSNYKLKVVPAAKADSTEITADAVTSGALTVTNYDRSGFAHTGKYATTTGVGAYNNDGTLKNNAVVLYVTNTTVKTVEMDVVTSTKGAITSCKGLQTILAAYEKGCETKPLCVRFIGEVKVLDAIGSKAEGLQVKGRAADSELNMTFEGIGNDAFIHGWGFLIRNAASVELRNFGVATGIDDDISLDTDNDHIWIHNIDAFYGPNKGGDQKKGDGAIDIKSNSKHVTVAYCHFWDTGKSSMCGMKSESGPNYITYHHNWFDHSDSRHARVRTMSVHMYNNYYDGIAKYGVGACNGSSVFMEANYFRACQRPMLISMQGTDTKMGTDLSDAPTFSGEDGGIIKSYANKYATKVTCVTYQTNSTHFDCWEATTRDAQVPAEVKTKQGGHTYDNFDTNKSLMYSYTPDAADDVPAKVTGLYGAGRIQHGDLQFTFTNADDAIYDVNNDLRGAIDNYKPTMVSIIGEVTVATAGGEKEEGEEEGEGGDGPTIIPMAGSWEWFWDADEEDWTTYNFQVEGNKTKKDQPAETFAILDGTEITTNVGLKIESATVISFTAPSACSLKMIFQNGQSGSIKIDGVKKTSSAEILLVDIESGAHELTKADSRNLFYMALVGVATNVQSVAEEVRATKFFHNGQLLIIRDGVTYDMMGRVVE